MLVHLPRISLRAFLLIAGVLFTAALTPAARAQGEQTDQPVQTEQPGRVSKPGSLTGGTRATVSGPTTQLQYLSGVDKDNTVSWNFICNNGSKANQASTIPVPANWELQGFGTYVYGNTASPTVRGTYSRTFSVPTIWAGQRIVLVFEGVQTETSVTVNGTAARLTSDGVTGATTVHQGGFYRFQYDVTSLLNYGAGNSNAIQVVVNGDSTANTSVNNAERKGDYWNFSGIFRPVYLEAFPAQSIDRVAVNAQANGSFTVDAYLAGVTGSGTVTGQIQDLSGNAVGAPFSAGIGSGTALVRLATTVASPRLWTAETPNLYQVVLSLNQGGATQHTVTQRFGFRTFEVRVAAGSGGFYVNGKRILLKGTNRHSFYPDSGRCLSESISRQDIMLMKGLNMNAVRMSHYPPDQHFLDDCDELGLYVLDELGGWQHGPGYDTATGTVLVKEMVIRDVNHPSILVWDNGNEGGWNTAVEGEYPKWDPQARPVNHPQTGGASTPWNSILDSHYLTYSQTQSATAGTFSSTPYVLMPSEFLHGLYDGGNGAGLADYWDLMRQDKVSAGGFLWAYLDEAIRRVDQSGTPLDSAGNAAPDGIVGPYRQLEGSALTVKEVWSPIVFSDAAVPAGANPTLRVENRYDFTDLNQCGFIWELRQFARPRDSSGGYTVVAQGTAATGSIPARTSGTLSLSLPSQFQTADALAIRPLDPTGNEVWTKVFPLASADAFRSATPPPGRLPVTATDTGTGTTAAVLVRSGDLAVTISSTTGRLTSVQRSGKTFSLANGPRIVSTTAATATFASIEHHADAGDQVVTATYSGNLQTVTWRIRRNGWVQVDTTYTLSGGQNFFGVGFDYPEANVQSMRWLGDGPYRTYKNRRQGAMFNVWQNTYNNVITGALRDASPSYPEFKGYYGNVRWSQFQTTEGPITAVLGRNDQFLQVFTPANVASNLQGQTGIAYPSASLSVLNAIPAIGTKFVAANTTGPAGQQAVASGTYTDSVSFYFGALP